jgi:beta-lactamase regulating signal transducer with metallopeptidase domain
MIGEATNHLWQTTLFAIAAGVLTLAFRRNAARVRYWLWFSASCKFLIPFSLLMTLGSRLERDAGPKTLPAPLPAVVLQISQPFSSAPLPAGSTQTTRDWTATAILGVWTCGFLAVALMRFRGWLRIRAALHASTLIYIPAPIEIRSSASLFDPAIVGLFRPVLLVPSGIVEHLRPTQWEAVLAHELCHARRRDNLTSALHMVVEAFFWFHPLVWWIGGRLVEERERACDEAVLEVVRSWGGEPRDYAEAIVGICKRYLKLPLECVSGVTGANLKKRIEEIMKNRIVHRLDFARKVALAGAGIAAVGAPILVGVMNSPVIAQLRAQSPPSPTPQIMPAAPKPDQVPPEAPPPGPIPGGRGAAASPDDQRRLEVIKARLGVLDAMTRIWERYGMPDQLQASSDPRNQSLIWHYNYLADFQSPVEFQSAPGGVRIVSPAPTATYYGQPGVSTALVESLNRESQSRGEPAAANAIAGLPGRHASVQIYPAKEYRMLSIPLDSLSGRVDVVAVVIKRLSDGASGAVVANVRDTVLEASPAIAPAETSPAGIAFANAVAPGSWQAHLTLDAGSYVCAVVVKERGTGRIYGETIDFEVK